MEHGASYLINRITVKAFHIDSHTFMRLFGGGCDHRRRGFVIEVPGNRIEKYSAFSIYNAFKADAPVGRYSWTDQPISRNLL